MSSGWWRGISLTLAVLLLDVSLTFHNIWPTPAITWRGEISVELGAYLCVLAFLAAVRRRHRMLSPRALRVLTVLWLLLVVGRYADVTATALFGRDINLYWDLRFIPDVVSLLAKAATVRLVLGVIGGILVLFSLLYILIRWATGRVATAAARDDERPIVAVAGLILVALFVGRFYEARLQAVPFAKPVTATYGRQVRVAVRALRGSNAVAASPPMTTTLSRVKDADVLLVFLESYGAVTFDRYSFSRDLAAPRAALDAAIHETNRDVVSGFVESPTFGGSSWLAHISLLSGVEVRDPDTNALVLIGEIGGTAEEEAAAWAAEHLRDVPKVAFIAGRSAPEGKRMGHAGAIISGGKGTAASKVTALEAAGFRVAGSPTELPGLLREAGYRG